MWLLPVIPIRDLFLPPFAATPSVQSVKYLGVTINRVFVVNRFAPTPMMHIVYFTLFPQNLNMSPYLRPIYVLFLNLRFWASPI